MAATLADRYRLAANALFIQRVSGAVLLTANTVGQEVVPFESVRIERRVNLAQEALANLADYGARFARAAAGWNPTAPPTDMADTFADTAGADDVKQAAISDNIIVAYVAGAWDVLAGVRPWETT
jgi:hypothetical protein